MSEKRDIGWAVDMMRHGRCVRRVGWNGKGMWLEFVNASGDVGGYYTSATGDRFNWQNFIAMKTADYRMVPWLCSQSDLLADDWELADEDS